MIKKELFGNLPGGEEVYSYTLSNKSITSFSIIDFGGIIKNIFVKNSKGEVADVVCGFDSVEGYLNGGGYQGALIGRYGNRISKGKFTLDGQEYTLFKNDGNNTLHGGRFGFNSKIWNVTEGGTNEEPAVILTYTSPDGEEGFPGTLNVKVTYTLTAEGGLSIHYEAETDKTTIVSLTNHAYFNIAGFDSGVIDDHLMWLDSDRVNELNMELIPTGEILDVTGTPYDFRAETPIGARFDDSNPMMKAFGGYDNNFCFTDMSGKYALRATVRDAKSGRMMSMYTDQPCVQIYTANMINVHAHPFKNNVRQYRHCAVCLETQSMPDSINHPGFTNVVLKPGEKYDTTTVYVFSNK